MIVPFFTSEYLIDHLLPGQKKRRKKPNYGGALSPKQRKARRRAKLAKVSRKKNLLLILFFAICLSSCSTTRNDGMFYKGTITKANGERKQKVFIFGRDACIRKSKKIARKRAKRRSYDRNPGYGITSMGRAKQRQ